MQLVEYDVTSGSSTDLVGRPLRDAILPPDSRVAAHHPGHFDDPAPRRRRDPARRSGRRDRVTAGCDRVGRASRPVGGRGEGRRHLRSRQGRHGDRPPAARAGHRGQVDRGEPRPRASGRPRPFRRHASTTSPASTPSFLEREHIGHAQAAVFAMREDAKNHYAATLARIHGGDVHDRDRPRRDLAAGLRSTPASTCRSIHAR